MYNLYNLEKNQLETFDDQMALNALQSGKYTVEQNKTYNMLNPNDDLVGIGGNEVFKAIDEGYRFAPAKIVDDARITSQYGDKDFQAGLFGLARGVSLNTSDIIAQKLLTHFFDADPDYIKNLQEANPNISLLSEVVGTIGPAFTGIGAGKALATGAVKLGSREAKKMLKKAAISPAYGASVLGGAIEAKIAGKLGSALPGVARRTIGRGAIGGIGGAFGGAVENMLYDTGRIVSEEALGRVDYTASSIFDSLKTSALLGGIFGFGANFVADAISQGSKNLIRRFPDAPFNIIDAGFGVKPEQQKKALFNLDFTEKLMKDDTAIKSKKDLADRLKQLYKDRLDTEDNLLIQQGKIKEQIAEGRKQLSNRIEDSKKFFKEAEKLLDTKVKMFKEQHKDIPISNSLILDITDDVNGLMDRVSRAKTESLAVLDAAGMDLDHVLTKDEFLSIIDDVKNRYKGNAGGFTSNELDSAMFALDGYRLKVTDKMPEEKFSPVVTKGIIEMLDMDNRSYYNPRSPLGFSPLKGKMLSDVRKGIDEILKGTVPDYKDAVSITHNLMNLRDEVFDVFKGIKGATDLRKISESISDTFKTVYLGMDQPFIKTTLKLGEEYGKSDYYNRIYKLFDDQSLAKSIPVKFRGKEGLSKDLANDEIAKRYYSKELAEKLAAKEDHRLIKYSERLTQDKKTEFLERHLNSVKKLKIREQEGKLTKIGELFKEAKRQSDLFKQAKGSESFQTSLKTTISAVDSKPIKEVFREISEITNSTGEIDDLIGWISALRLQHAFNRSIGQGSRNPKIWDSISKAVGGISGVVIGGAMGGPGSAIVAAYLGQLIAGGFGVVLGAHIDKYGPRVALKILRKISEIKGGFEPHKITKATVEAIGPEYNKTGQKFLYDVVEAQKEIYRFNKNMANKIKRAADATAEGMRVPIKVYHQVREGEFGEMDYNELSSVMEDVRQSRERYFTEDDPINDVIFPIMPNIIEGVKMKTVIAADFLERKFPQRPLTDIFNEWEPTKYELEKFKKYLTYTFKPSLALEEGEQGYINPEGIETLKVVHPSIYQDLQEVVTEKLMEPNVYKKLSPQSRAFLARAFDFNPMDIYRHDKMMMLQNLKSPLVDQSQPAIGQVERGQNAGQGTGNMKQTGLNSLAMNERAETRMDKIGTRV